MDSEDGKVFIKHLAHYVRTHEKALANALQLQRRSVPARPNVVGSAPTQSPTTPTQFGSSPTASSTFAAAFSLPSLTFTSQSVKPVKLSLTPHHLFYLLTRFAALNISVGPMDVRLESLRAEAPPSNYVSFLRDSTRRSRQDSDSMSIHSVSSVRSVMSGVSTLWSSFLSGQPSARQVEKSKAALDADLKYLYSAFTKIPCLKLAPDRKAKLVEGFEEFPFDTAVPLLCFKNVSALEITDIDIRQFFGWDQLAERLRSLSVRKGCIEDVSELIISIVLDDMDRRRRRSSKAQSSPIVSHSPSPAGYPTERAESSSAPPSPKAEQSSLPLSGSAPASHPMSRGPSNSSRSSSRPRSSSPARPPSSRNGSTTASQNRSSRMRRSGSGGSHSSSTSTVIPHHGSTSDVTFTGALPSSKWRFLRHLCLAENNLVSINTAALAPLAGSLTSLDLSSNQFSAVPEAISILSNLRALNLSHNLINSLHSLTHSPLPAITAFNLRANRLSSLAGIERLLSLERVDLRENVLTDPTELARLTSAPNISEIWIAHNPFTKTHSTYRVTIFNLFRSTPGYTEDIILDGSGPGMVERRSLIDRVAEPPNPPVVRLPQAPSIAPTKITPIEAKKRDDPQLLRRDSEKSIHIVTQGQVAKARKKGGRRRVVELNKDDQSTSFDDHLSPVAASQNSQAKPLTPVMTTTSPGQTESVESVRKDVSISYPVHTTTEQVDWELKGDEYKKRIEALKSEVGSGWLTVLSEEGWDGSQGNHRQYNSESITPPPNQVRTPLTLS